MSRDEFIRRGARYLGDGVYVCSDGMYIWLGTQRDTWETIALEPTMLNDLVDYAENINEARS